MDAAACHWDVVVVGAGPAGCAAAYDLAAAGRSVLLLDKRQFPRHKSCAGGLTVKAVKALRYSIDPVVRQTVGRVRLEAHDPPCANPRRIKEPRPYLRNDRTRRTGRLLPAEEPSSLARNSRPLPTIRQIVRSESGVCLETSGRAYHARFLIGADGASGQVRRMCAQGPWFSQGFALEVEAAPRKTIPEFRDVIFDFAAIGGGYGWIFPKRDHLNVGLYVPAQAGTPTRDQLLRYVQQRLGVDATGQVTGQYLGLGAAEFRAEYLRADLRDRVFLVGDAGGFVDALTGEGIYGALLSGQAAARAILFETRGHGSAVQAFATYLEDYRQTLRFSSRAAAAFYRQPARGFRLMRLPFVRRTLVKTYTHGLNIKSLPMRIALARA